MGTIMSRIQRAMPSQQIPIALLLPNSYQQLIEIYALNKRPAEKFQRKSGWATGFNNHGHRISSKRVR